MVCEAPEDGANGDERYIDLASDESHSWRVVLADVLRQVFTVACEFGKGIFSMLLQV